MSKLSSIFASPNHQNFQDLMRKNYKKGVKSLTQLSFTELETGHYGFYKRYLNTEQYQLDVDPKNLKDFNIVGFDVEVSFTEEPGKLSLLIASAGDLNQDSVDYLRRNLQEEPENNDWTSLLVDEIAANDALETIFKNLHGNFTSYIFMNGELFVFSSERELRADNRLNMSNTSVAYSKVHPNRTLLKIDTKKKKLYPIFTA